MAKHFRRASKIQVLLLRTPKNQEFLPEYREDRMFLCRAPKILFRPHPKTPKKRLLQSVVKNRSASTAFCSEPSFRAPLSSRIGYAGLKENFCATICANGDERQKKGKKTRKRPREDLFRAFVLRLEPASLPRRERDGLGCGAVVPSWTGVSLP